MYLSINHTTQYIYDENLNGLFQATKLTPTPYNGLKIMSWKVTKNFETGGEKYVDVSIVVTASETTQQSRVVSERKVPLEIFNAIKDQQMPDRDKLKKADYIISTDNNIEDTKSEVKEVAAKIKLINPKAWNTFFNQ